MLKYVCLAAALIAAATPAAAQQVDLASGSVVQTVSHLRAGQYVWAPEVAPQGPMLLIVNLSTQRAVLFRNGVPVGASTVSTGRPGHRTPTGVFSVLQKHVEHYSTIYDNAPMPYMQRLTWTGVALHAGKLPGYPASHGCIRLPAGFARLLYGESSLGMTVVITDRQITPRIAPTPAIVAQSDVEAASTTGVEWTPGKSPSGPVSILVSAADRRAVAIRNGVVIGSAPVTVDGPVTNTWAYALRSVDAQGQHLIRMNLSSMDDGQQVPREEWARFHAPDEFRQAVAAIVAPGTTVIVTSDSLASTNGLATTTVLEGPTQIRAHP
jgi:hypothetical protein